MARKGLGSTWDLPWKNSSIVSHAESGGGKLENAGPGYSNFRSLLKLHVKGICEALPLAPGVRMLHRPAGSPNPWRKFLVKIARSPGVGSRRRSARQSVGSGASRERKGRGIGRRLPPRFSPACSARPTPTATSGTSVRASSSIRPRPHPWPCVAPLRSSRFDRGGGRAWGQFGTTRSFADSRCTGSASTPPFAPRPARPSSAAASARAIRPTKKAPCRTQAPRTSTGSSGSTAMRHPRHGRITPTRGTSVPAFALHAQSWPSAPLAKASR